MHGTYTSQLSMNYNRDTESEELTSSDSSEYGSNNSDADSVAYDLPPYNHQRDMCQKNRLSCISKPMKMKPYCKNVLRSCKENNLSAQINVRKMQQRKTKRVCAIPILTLPLDEPGIMWCGNLRRLPIFIFSRKYVMKKSDVVENLGRIFNMTFRLVRTECKLLRSILHSHGFQESINQLGRFNLLWTGSHLNPYQLRLLTEFHKINHFPRSYELTRKDRLARNVQQMQTLKGRRQFDFIPPSFILPDEFREFCAAYLQDRGLYIVKPIASSRGRGIFIISHPEEVPFDEPCIVSRYISNPYLIDGFKFDVRIYVAVTSYDPLFVYVYEEGLVRFATIRYQSTTQHLRTQCMHLTNYSVNKKNLEFVQNNDENVEDFGNKWSLGALLRFLQSAGVDATGLMLRIEEIIIKSFLCVLSPIASACGMYQASKGRCFELYGFDIIVDENLRPWLLEVNLSPSLNCDSPLDLKVKSHMLTDLFNLVGIVCHDSTRKTQGAAGSRWHVMANGLAAAPATSSAYFVRAKEQVSSHVKTSVGIPPEHRTFASGSSSSSNASLRDLVDCVSGTNVAELLPPSLTVEEVKLIRRLQEEACRAGGWIRLLPNPEAWEQYCCLWPNDTGYIYSSADRTTLYNRSGSAQSVNSSASKFMSRASERTSDDQRMSLNSSLASAFYAASAATVLHFITASHFAKRLSNKSGTFVLGPSLDNHQHNLDTVLHPNSCNIPVDLVSHRRKKCHPEKDYRHPTNAFRTPSIEAFARVRLPLHSMPPIRLQNCLDKTLACDNASSNVSSSPVIFQSGDKFERVARCYKNTLSHMPFYLRQLGQPPQGIPGVCLSAKCHSSLLEQGAGDTQAGATRCNNSFPVTTASSPASIRLKPRRCHRKERFFTDKQRTKTNRTSTLNDSDSSRNKPFQTTPLSTISTSHAEKKNKLSIIQARHAFAAYLSRVTDRLLAEVNSPNPLIDLVRDEKQIDLLFRFLTRVSATLSSEAIATVCCKYTHYSKINNMDAQHIFEVPNLDKTKSILERKIKIADCLHQFIQVYQYETVAILLPNIPKSQIMHEMDPHMFWKFVGEASEAELEKLLTRYTHSNNSLHYILGPLVTTNDHSTSFSKDHSGSSTTTLRSSVLEPQLLPLATPARIVGDQVASGYSTDSGIVTSLDTKSNQSIYPMGSDPTQTGSRWERTDLVDSPITHRSSVPTLPAWASCCLQPREGSGDCATEQYPPHRELSTPTIVPIRPEVINSLSHLSSARSTQKMKSNSKHPISTSISSDKLQKTDEKTNSSWQNTLCLPLRKTRNSFAFSDGDKTYSLSTTVDSCSQTSKAKVTMRRSRNPAQKNASIYKPSQYNSLRQSPRCLSTKRSPPRRYHRPKQTPMIPLCQIRSMTPNPVSHRSPPFYASPNCSTNKDPTNALIVSKFAGDSSLSSKKGLASSVPTLATRRALKYLGSHHRYSITDSGASFKSMPLYRSSSTHRIHPFV